MFVGYDEPSCASGEKNGIAMRMRITRSGATPANISRSLRQEMNA